MDHRGFSRAYPRGAQDCALQSRVYTRFGVSIPFHRRKGVLDALDQGSGDCDVRVLLISANTERISMLPLPLGLACVAAACRRAGHELVLLNLMFEGDAGETIGKHIEEFRPEVIGVSVRNIDDQNMADPKFLLPAAKDVVDACRRLSGAPIVLGGAGYSIFPERALHYLGADMGIRGEGEVAFPALLERLARGEDPHGLAGVYLPGRPAAGRTFATALDELPLPEPELWIPTISGGLDFWVPVQGKRGCPMGCTYCSTSVLEGRHIRRRSPGKLAVWLEDLASRGYREFGFVDNTFNIPPSYAKAVSRAIIARGLDITLWCIVYPKWVDGELAELMARAGCREVSLGFESGSDCVLNGFHKRFGKDEVREAARVFREAGIVRRGFLMLGGPQETRETVQESFAFVDSLELDSLSVTTGVRVYPETEIAAVAAAQGIISPEDDLLQPTFYLVPRMKDWLPEKVAAYKASRPWVT
jgi:radical SAM superfamily enzyme YgiQ (UPF0313 family)